MTTLRQVLQEVVRARGVKGACWCRNGKEWTTEKVAEGLWIFEVMEEKEGLWSVGACRNSGDEVSIQTVLENMHVVTESRRGFLMESEPPYSNEDGRCHCGNMDPLYMCRLGAKLFVR